MSEVEGLTGLRKRLAAISDPKMILGRIALEGVKQAKIIAAGTFSKTANLERSIRVGTVTETTARIEAGGINSVGYARFVEFGTGVHGPLKRRIVPKSKPFMAWRVDTGGGGAGGAQLRLTGSSRTRKGVGVAGWAYAKSTQGRRATPYLWPGAQKAVADSGIEPIILAWNEAD
jgi:hypothetical protein